MSFQAMAWAAEQKVPATQKIVLLMLANRVNHDTGRCTPRIKFLAEECGMSESACKVALKALADGGFLEIEKRYANNVQCPNQYFLNPGVGSQKTHGGSQEDPEVGLEKTGVGRQKTHGGSPKNPGVGCQKTTEPGSSEPGSEPVKEPVSRFADFWSAWPTHKRKVDRKKCEAHWARHNLDKLANVIIAHVHHCRASRDWVKQGGAYIPGPLVYLHREQYLAPVDEPAQATQSTHSGFETRNYREGIADDGSFT